MDFLSLVAAVATVYWSDILSDFFEDTPAVMRILLSAIFVGIAYFILGVLFALAQGAYIPIILGAAAYKIAKLKDRSERISVLINVAVALANLAGIGLLMWLAYRYYAQIFTKLPYLIILASVSLAFIVGQKKPLTVKLILLSLMLLVVATTIFIAIPQYTYFEAAHKLAGDLDLDIESINLDIRRMMPTLPPLSVFVDGGYVLEVLVDDQECIYWFNPVSGDWNEISRSQP